jgi:hypothetical protein
MTAYPLTDEQSQTILTVFYEQHPEMRTEASRREYNARYSRPLPADEHELLVQALDEATTRRAKRVADVERLRDQLKRAKNAAAYAAYAIAMHTASVAMADAEKVERYALERLNRYRAKSDRREAHIARHGLASATRWFSGI